ncbi:hypothetical protein BGZ59_007880 [Podila verticillata]|nr:hypothetical protein BGZ59_007880 [Podila verticillata]
MPHLFEIPELIYRIGWFLCFNCELEDYFDPQDLIVCSQVNRLFHKTLTPLLWMVITTDFRDYTLPKDVVEANIHHTRHLVIYSSDQPIWGATNLRTLLVHRFIETRRVVDLIHSNPHLTSVEWHFPVGADRDQQTLILPALATLSQLRYLYLRNWRFENIDLAVVLCSTPLLLELNLYLPHGLGGCFDQCRPLENLTILWLSCFWPKASPGFPQLLRYCPNLETLYLNPLLECPIVKLSTNLRECCPRLKTLKCGPYFHHDIFERIWPADKDLALIESAAGLDDFDLPLCDLTSTVLQTLLTRHAHTLTKLALFFYRGGDPGTMANMSSILASCLSLREFTAGIVGGAWKPIECLRLFKHSWSQNLRLFEFSGVSTDLYRSAYGDDDGFYDDSEPYSGNDVFEDFDFDPSEIGVEECQEGTSGQEVKFMAQHGWRVPENGKDRQLQSRDSNILCRRLLERAVSMPLMDEVQLNIFSWRKITVGDGE